MIDEMMMCDVRVGDVVEVCGSRGHVLSDPAPLVEGIDDGQRFVMVYFFRGKAASARCAVNVLVTRAMKIVASHLRFENEDF